MLTLDFTAQDLAHTRFAFSPLWEVIAGVRALKYPGDHPLHRPWMTQALPRLRHAEVDWAPLGDLVPQTAIPGFVCAPPTVPLPELDLELAALLDTPPEVVRRDLDEALPGERTDAITALYEDPAAGLAVLVDRIRLYWELALAPYWARILALLEADVLYRARQLVTEGAGALLNDLDPAVRWEGETLRVAHRHVDDIRALGGKGLLLVPSVFVWPRVFSATTPPDQPVLRYPPRGVATLWERGSDGPPEALAAVVGRSRARLLTELAVPASTTDLARRTSLSTGAVSQHLSALRACGLVSAHRAGRFVLYARTRPAEALLTASE